MKLTRSIPAAAILSACLIFALMLPVSAETPTVKGGDPVLVKMETSKGDIIIEMNAEKAPVSVKNFLSYVDKGFYDSTIFHRIISTFMIQAGGFSKDMKPQKTDSSIINEWKNGLKNVRGSIAMGRTQAPNSATSHFFINVVDNASLDMPRGGAAYAVFGKVIEGMDVVDAIKVVKTGAGDVPVEPVFIIKAARVDKDKSAEEKKEK